MKLKRKIPIFKMVYFHEDDVAGPLSPVVGPLLRLWFRVFYFLVRLYYTCKNMWIPKEVVPPPNADDPNERLLLTSATELAAMIWRKEITATHLMEVYITRAHLVNKRLNTVEHFDEANALSQAQKIDEELESMNPESEEYRTLLERRPFLGVPMTVKDHISMKGMKVTIGLKCFEHNPPCPEDAVLIQRYRAAGAIPFCMTNVPEAVMWIETDNVLYGRTVNPYDSRKNPGGSSGGEAAMCGGAGSVIGVGSDIGGSIRQPAANCGVFGLKSTNSLIINTEGFIPGQFEGEQAQMASMGPVCRYASDLRHSYKLFVGPENAKKMRLDEPVDLKAIKYFYMEGSKCFATIPWDAEVRDAFMKAVNYFEKELNQPVVRVDLPLIDYCADIWCEAMGGKGALPLPCFFEGFDRRVLREKLRRQCSALLGEDGILIFPTYPHSSYFHNEPLLSFLHCQNITVWNALAFPAIVVPMGLDSDGTPLSVQLVAAPMNERLLIAAAEELERGFGGWTPPRV